jgi:hypothetical protein
LHFRKFFPIPAFLPTFDVAKKLRSDCIFFYKYFFFKFRFLNLLGIFVVSETGSHSINQAGLDLVILLPQPPACWD